MVVVTVSCMYASTILFNHYKEHDVTSTRMSD